MRKFSISIDINASTEGVWQVMSDVERWHEWTASITSVKRLDRGPFTVGSRAKVVQPKFPPAVWKVTAMEPGKSFTWVNRIPFLLHVSARHWVEPALKGSRASLSLDMRGILGGLLGRLTRDITERYLALEAAGLKARSENPAFRHSAS